VISVIHTPKHQAPLPGNHAQLPGKGSAFVCRDQTVAGKLRLYDFEASRKHYEEWHTDVVGRKQDFATLDVPQFAEWADAVDLGCRENGESLGGGVKSTTNSRQGRHVFSYHKLPRAS